MKNLIMVLGLLLFLSCKKEANDFTRIIGNYKCTVEHLYWDMTGTTIHEVKFDTLKVSSFGDDNIMITPDYNLTNSLNSFKLNSIFCYDLEGGGGITQIHIKFILANDSIAFYSQNGGLGGRNSFTINGNKMD